MKNLALATELIKIFDTFEHMTGGTARMPGPCGLAVMFTRHACEVRYLWAIQIWKYAAG